MAALTDKESRERALLRLAPPDPDAERRAARLIRGMCEDAAMLLAMLGLG